MRLFFKVSGIVFVLLVFMGCGYVAGAKREAPTTVIQSEKFVKLTSTTAFDTRNGTTCDLASGINKVPHTLINRESRKIVQTPQGLTLTKWPDDEIPGDENGYPYCSDLENR